MAKYTYSITTDITAAKADANKMKYDYEKSDIPVALDYINLKGDVLDIYTKADLSESQESDLDDIVEAHDGIPLLEPEIEIDNEGRQVSRIAAGKKGWTYIAHPIEIETSVIDGCFSSEYTGTARTDFEMELYKADGTLITTQGVADTDCVKTVLTFKPLYDYEIISGNIFQSLTTTEDVRIWAIGGAFAVGSNTPVSVKEFASGINMKFIGNDDHIETDGRASKIMTKDITAYGLAFPTYQGNCFQFIITHPAGYKHNIMAVLEYFRA